MTKQQALSVMDWLQEVLREGYDVDILYNPKERSYDVLVAYEWDDRSRLVIYDALKLEGEDL